MALSDFAVELPHERVHQDRKSGLWFMSEGSIPTYTIEEVTKGLETHPNILVRTQHINEHGHKTVLSREESLSQLKNNGKIVVEGANLHVNEYGTRNNFV